METGNGRMNSQCIIYWYFYGVGRVPHIFSKENFKKYKRLGNSVISVFSLNVLL